MERGAEYYLATRQQYFNRKIEEWSPESQNETSWSIFENLLKRQDRWKVAYEEYIPLCRHPCCVWSLSVQNGAAQ